MKSIRNNIIFTILIGVSLISSAAGQSDQKPNVILILADDMALADLSALNGGLSRTPVLDRLKEEGVWFENAYSGSPVCAPARASLLTGKYPHRTGVVSLTMKTEPEVTSLKTSEVTMADVFKSNGYKTSLVGKWHLGDLPPFHPQKRGFDEFKGFVGYNLKTYYKFKLDENGTLINYEGEYLDDVLTSHAIDFIEGNKDNLFFLHLAYSAPHRPLGGPEVLIDHYRAKGFSEKTAKVYAMIEAMDKGIGRVMNKLDDMGIRENTLIIFASDNGIDPGVAPRFNLGMKGTKYTVYEGGIHVPLLFNWSKHLEPKENENVVTFADLFPTLVDLLDLQIAPEVSEDFDGISLVASLQGNPNDGLPEARFWQWNRHEPFYSHNAAVRIGDWKLVRPASKELLEYSHNIDSESKLPLILYDLSSDPSESKDLSDAHPQKVSEMLEVLEEWSRSVEKDRMENADFIDGELSSSVRTNKTKTEN